MNFHSVICSREGKLTLELAGEIDGSSAAEICYRIERLNLRACSLDFSRVETIGVFGARVLARGLKALRGDGFRFELDGLPRGIAQTLCLGGVIEAVV
ncbi:MAG TPA: STAS domain-containing protein [Candidatus Methylomirabilis sp.]|nr:STAS domain-containing protein [Candidatus Methylomirabilis sp.]